MQMRFILFFLFGLEKLECFVFFRSVGGYTNQCIFFFVGSKNSIFFVKFIIFYLEYKVTLNLFWLCLFFVFFMHGVIFF